MTMHIPFDNTYAALPSGFYTAQPPTAVKAPSLLAFNAALAARLGIDAPDADEIAAVFAGNTVPDGAAPLAQLYAGHQFGNFNPQLGDGRALLLGEVIDQSGTRRDIQLKGSGPTPYSRMGDGRAWLGPVLREYVVSEAMHALGIPTTRALAAVATGEPIWREQGALPGAVLTRVAASHLRVGTFQVFAHRGQIEDLRTLTDYAIARHYPQADGPMGLLAAVCAAQAELIAAWMSVGFIHGVMNTDNCAISGETIDYGPCAFMDAYDEARVFSSIDQQGRYAYGNQPRIAVWNCAQLATALIRQMDDMDAAVEEATAIVHAMPGQLQAAWLKRFGAKLGLSSRSPEDQPLIEDLLALMQSNGADFTNTFAALGSDTARDQFTDRDAFDAWNSRWQARIASEPDAAALMARSNPRIIPRNHRMEQMIEAAVAGDMAPFQREITALAAPFDPKSDPDLMRPPTQQEIVPATFCGT
ncbi:YdiU family protein [Sulfitobacter pseudonitzschiae]|uniref:Protein nucleotidyltransferase YdiU n=1 Tax=Pseudosulfitobacter pseudonitzschiae TaxID=1402135 RepID=A0A9Q2NJX8_9RHOB|nr:YdiU family protein [Pseudosulfitobacter pseudonitzschiae]MBM2291004.1 YdiU family protein [Pseudosulfitobacter pseudonitzschiae]MBM2295922.1 YdiU family protein [Pseudosulfitobacter pseudonitzschiae]MBM2300835.1 YdiU family protein [Pseudosulfitobacter pseudonitzschiae]MBM2310619.1 YdiU family protein [Pseudosulfitobacter pseudonitzschiae]MBM2315532.1 YdiU family protein [Pseudosulfitobacter pseudonitzschiae]